MTQASSDALRVWTVPNLLSFVRLAGVPLFLYLLLGPHADGWALIVLALSAITDWADGKLARLLGQYSKLGEMLDPAADRLYILATLVGFVIRDFIPWWVAVIIVGRDLVLAVFLGIGLTRDPRKLPSNLIDRPAPAFKLQQVAAPDKSFSPADMKGQVWLLNVWASWCVACRVEHPLLMEMAKANTVPLIGLDYKDKPEDALKFLARHGKR